jgi:hypothetical protein
MAEKLKYDYTKRSVGERVAVVTRLNGYLYTTIGILTEFTDEVVRVKTPTIEVKLEREELNWFLPPESLDENGDLTKTGRLFAKFSYIVITGEKFNEQLKIGREQHAAWLKVQRGIPKSCRIMAVV